MTNHWQDVYQRVQALIASDAAVLNGAVYPRWISSETFWYDRQTSNEDIEFRIVEAPSGHSHIAFTQSEVARQIAAILGIAVDARLLILKTLDLNPASETATFSAFDESWQLDLKTHILSRAQRRDDTRWSVSPDGRTAVFVKAFDLWARDVASGAERALTSDGEEANAYAEVPLAYRPIKARLSRGPEGAWSPDSRYFLTAQTDERQVAEFPILDYAPVEGLRPRVNSNRTSLPGDVQATEYRLVAIEVATGRQIEAQYRRLPGVRMNETIFASGLAWWSEDSRTAYFVDIERGERRASVVAFDMSTRRCRVVFSEASESALELSVNVYARSLIEPLPRSSELIWYSERTGHGHLYLYDLTSGACKSAITGGKWQVREILHVDAARREVVVRAGGILPEEDPYVCKPYLASFDGSQSRVLSAERGDHTIWRSGDFGLMLMAMYAGTDTRRIGGFSPDGAYFVETVGTTDRLPISTLRNRTGELITVLESADGTLLPAHWRWPEPFTVKAADGVTDLYGLLYKPPDLDPERSYPIIDLIYGGPQFSHVPKSAFVQFWPTATLLEAASLAELGAFSFIVDGRGTAEREREFRTASYGAIERASNLEDHIATVQALAARHPQIDVDRVGITGFSAGGYMSAMASCRHGEFFKVSVACSGNFDQSLFWLGWGERYHGLYDKALYERQAVRTYAHELRGKLLLIHGLLDGSVHPAGLFQFVQALIEANKDFDLVILPRAAHEVTGYALRKRLDYFVKHLIGEQPGTEVRFSMFADRLAARLAANVRPR